MQNSCPSCGAETFPGARFCRRCGAPVGGGAGTGDVSPHAATVPLAPENVRTTDGLQAEEERAAQQTSRVSVAEMERLLRARDEAQTPRGVDPAAKPADHPSAATRPEFTPADEELTITVPRTPEAGGAGDFETTVDFEATQVADFEATRPSSSMPPPPGHVTSDLPADASNGTASHDSPAGTVVPGAAGGAGAVAAGARGARPRRAWPVVVAVCVAVAVFAAGGAWLAFRLLRRPAVTDVPTQPSAPPVTDAALQQFEQKLAEAESLLAAGDMPAALARLREANGLDPANTRAHRRLAELLHATGRTREAMEEYRAVTRNAPDDFDAWNRLAALQVAEGLDRDAVESFRRFIALMGGEAAVSPADLLAYARALLRSGQTGEARAVFQRLAAGPDPVAAGAAVLELDQLARAQATPAPTQAAGAQASPTPGAEMAAAPQPAAQPAAQPQPTPPPPTPAPAPPAASSPADRYGRGVQLWSSNRGAALEEFRAAASGGNLDAHYYLGLAYVEGRSAGSLKRAEVVAALQHFQLAQRGGQHASQARGYAQQLEKEFDRLRRQ